LVSGDAAAVVKDKKKGRMLGYVGLLIGTLSLLETAIMSK
jgi:hypothetical protein